MIGQVLERDPNIEGVRWVENIHIRTGSHSGILLAGEISTCVIREPQRPTEYSVWGIHLATDDELTFIRKADESPVVIRMVDCRRGSATAGAYTEITCMPDPDRRLVIPRGVAHLPTGVNGLVTVNSPRIYWDWRRRLVHPDLDVINVERDRPVDRFPLYDVCRFPVPKLLYPAALAAFRTRYRPDLEAPFIFDRGGRLYVLRRRKAAQ
jgi:hypothetical protein